MEHSINLKGRSDLLISGVEHIYSFSDKRVEIQTCEGKMVIDGEGLDMNKLNLEENIISVQGTINSIVYSKSKDPKEGFLKKVFK